VLGRYRERMKLAHVYLGALALALVALAASGFFYAAFVGVSHPNSDGDWVLERRTIDTGPSDDVDEVKRIVPSMLSEEVSLWTYPLAIATLPAAERDDAVRSPIYLRQLHQDMARIWSPELIADSDEYLLSDDWGYEAHPALSANVEISGYQGVHVWGDTATVVAEGHEVWCDPGCEPNFEAQFVLTLVRDELAPYGWRFVRSDQTYLNLSDYT